MNRRTAFLIGILFQLLAVFGLFIPYVYLLANGTTVTLRTVPIDPRSIFRGDYVVLGYEVGMNVQPEESYGPATVVLEQKGEVFERVAVITDGSTPVLKPGQVCLRGQRQWNAIVFPDIAQYFVGEGLGRQFEEARNAHRLLVDVAISPSCRAVIRGIRFGPEVPPEEVPGVFPPPERPIPAPVR